MTNSPAEPLATRYALFRGVRIRFGKQSWSFAVGICGFSIIVLAAIFAPMLTPYDPVALDFSSALQAPNWSHPFGTDNLGRDVLARVLYAARVDLQIGAIGQHGLESIEVCPHCVDRFLVARQLEQGRSITA